MKKKNTVKSANINSFLLLGVVLVGAAVAIGAFFPQAPSVVSTVLYIMGVTAFVLYMWEIQYRRRTGDYNDEGTGAGGKNGKKRK
jgi:Fe2+ transport system protein B